MSRGPSASNSDSYLTTSQPHASAVSNEFQGGMNAPQINCPPGLEYLTTIDQLLVRQEVEGFASGNKFIVKNSSGQKVYYAFEESDDCARCCYGPSRDFQMHILDNEKKEVIHLYRPFACPSCCFPSDLHRIEVSAPPGTFVGTVEQEWGVICPTFAIKNSSGEICLKIESPFTTTSFGGEVNFKIMSAYGNTQIGTIAKQWSGVAREMFTVADNFAITFPMDLDVRMKAVILGACILIDTLYYGTYRN